jgi:hypothetical protein
VLPARTRALGPVSLLGPPADPARSSSSALPLGRSTSGAMMQVQAPPSKPQLGGGTAVLAAGRRAQTAKGAIGALTGLMSGLDDLKESMQQRRQSAATKAKELGPSGGGGGGAARGAAAAARGGAGGGVSLRWPGTKSFLERTGSNL